MNETAVSMSGKVSPTKRNKLKWREDWVKQAAKIRARCGLTKTNSLLEEEFRNATYRIHRRTRDARQARELGGMCALSASRFSSSRPFPRFSSHPPGTVSSYKANVHIAEYSCSCCCCGCNRRPVISRESTFHPVSFLGSFSPVKILALRTNSVITSNNGMNLLSLKLPTRYICRNSVALLYYTSLLIYILTKYSKFSSYFS